MLLLALFCFETYADVCSAFLVLSGTTQMHVKLLGNPSHPKLLFLHGSQEEGSTWDKIVEAFSETHHVILPDFRGHGLTPAAGEDYSPKALAQDLKIVLESLSIQKISIIGNSIGGRVGIAFAAQYPERVESLTLEDSVVKGNLKQKNKIENYRKQFLSTHHPMAFNLFFYASGMADDLSDPFKSVQCPVFAFAGDPNWVNIPQGSTMLLEDEIKRLRELKPDLKVVTAQGIGHQIHAVQPDFFTHELKKFLNIP